MTAPRTPAKGTTVGRGLRASIHPHPSIDASGGNPPFGVRPRRYTYAMSFGRNPHVAKAEAAELKAGDATDVSSYEQAWREAGRQWERASEREADAKRKQLYAANAERARATADAPRPDSAIVN
jgi:hypothetical protein